MTKYIQASFVKMSLHVSPEGQISLTAIQDQERSRPLSCPAVPILWLHMSTRGMSRDGRRWQERTGSGERRGAPSAVQMGGVASLLRGGSDNV